jgi:aminopeptidase N
MFNDSGRDDRPNIDAHTQVQHTLLSRRHLPSLPEVADLRQMYPSRAQPPHSEPEPLDKLWPDPLEDARINEEEKRLDSLLAALADESDEPVEPLPNLNVGGSTPGQYALPADATELQDLIEYREMNFALGNIFKAAYRNGTCSHSDELREINKILWFATRERRRIIAKMLGDRA